MSINFKKNAKRKDLTMLLIVSKPKILAEDLSDMMNFMGILSLAATPAEAREILGINKLRG